LEGVSVFNRGGAVFKKAEPEISSVRNDKGEQKIKSKAGKKKKGIGGKRDLKIKRKDGRDRKRLISARCLKKKKREGTIPEEKKAKYRRRVVRGGGEEGTYWKRKKWEPP